MNEKKKVILFDVVLSGNSQGLKESVVLQPLPCKLLKGFAEQNQDVRNHYVIEVVTVQEDFKPEDYIPIIAEQQPFLVGFSTYTWNYMHILNATRLLRTFSPVTIIIWGGPQVSYNPLELMSEVMEVDMIVCGPGETAFRNILLSFLGKTSLKVIPALAYRTDGGVRQAPGGFFVEDLDLVPSPFQNGLIQLEPDHEYAIYLETFRGCVKKCGYCVWGGGLKKLLYYPLRSILRDIEIIYSNPNVKHVYITDAFLFYNPRRAYKILEKIQSVNAGRIPTFLEFDPLHLKAEHIPFVKPVCQSDYRIGVQSFSDRALTLASRSKSDRELIDRQVSMIRREDPDARISFALIYGLPGDSLAGFRDTLSYAMCLQPDSMKINVLSVLPGSEYWFRSSELGLIYEKLPPHRLLHSNDFSEADMKECELISAWVLFLFRFPLFKRSIYTLLQKGLLVQPILLVDSLRAVMVETGAFIQTMAERTGISVEAENKRRMALIGRGDDVSSRSELYHHLKDILADYHQYDLMADIEEDCWHYRQTGMYIDFHTREAWKR